MMEDPTVHFTQGALVARLCSTISLQDKQLCMIEQRLAAMDDFTKKSRVLSLHIDSLDSKISSTRDAFRASVERQRLIAEQYGELGDESRRIRPTDFEVCGIRIQSSPFVVLTFVMQRASRLLNQRSAASDEQAMCLDMISSYSSLRCSAATQLLDLQQMMAHCQSHHLRRPLTNTKTYTTARQAINEWNDKNRRHEFMIVEYIIQLALMR